MDLILQLLLPFFGILLGLLIIHEAAHFFTAKLFGVKVLEAGIGMPPRIWGFRWRDTDYTLNAIPLGAFVRMKGEEDPNEATGETALDSLAAQPKWKRTIIIGSGAAINLVAAILLFAISLMVPQQVSAGGAVIGDVLPGSPAEKAGLQEGDQIYKINGRRAESTQDASYLIHLGQGSMIDFTVKRTDARTGTEMFTLPVYARWDPPAYADQCGIQQQQGPTGISLATRQGQYYPLTEAERTELFPEAKKAFAEHKQQVAPGSPASCTNGAAFGFESVSASECTDFTPEERAEAEALKREIAPESSAPCYQFDPPPNFAPFLRTRTEPIWDAVPHGARLSFDSLILMRNLVWIKIRGFGGVNSSPITGPVGIAQATGEVVEAAGYVQLITLAASLSMSLAVLNFMPIPAVDGGRLFFILIEFLRRGRRIAPEKEALVHLAGFAALIMLFLVVTYFDILRIVNGDSLLR